MLGRVALNNNRTLFLFVTADDAARLDIFDSTAQKAVLRDAFDDGKWESSRILAELERTQDLYFDRVSQIKMPAWSQGRIALVGDAAFCVSLMAGQGAALAMTAAYVLAGELGKAGPWYDKAFRGYERILRTFIESKQKDAARFASAFAPKTRWGLFVRNQIIKASAIPRSGPAFVRRGYYRHLETSRLPVGRICLSYGCIIAARVLGMWNEMVLGRNNGRSAFGTK